MAKKQNRQKKLERKKRKRRERLSRGGSSSLIKTSKMDLRIDLAHQLIDDGDYEEAEVLVDELIKRKPRNTGVIRAQISLGQAIGDHEAACIAAGRLMLLSPDDPEAVVMYAQESMFCGRASLALVHYRKFLDQWPNHAFAKKVHVAIRVIEPECEKRLADARKKGFTKLGMDDGGLELFALHEAAVKRLRNEDIQGCVSLCEELLAKEPDFVSARNNLAVCSYQLGDAQAALETVEETCRRFPENRFAEALLAELAFLTGDAERANNIASRFVERPAVTQDALIGQLKVLTFLGRDEDVLLVADVIADVEELDPENEGILSHYRAVALCRTGDEKQARADWKKCLSLFPRYPEATDNLASLDSDSNHSAWGDSIHKWLPQAILEQVLQAESRRLPTGFLKHHPATASLIPTMLDRGDPTARELALILAKADESPEMLTALHNFALSNRGPDSMRLDALQALKEKKKITNGPVRFFSKGKWTEIKMWVPKITYEAVDVRPWESELSQNAVTAMHSGDFDTAESIWDEVLERYPENPTATFNRASVWQARDGEEGGRRAKETIRDLHGKEPDYLFARVAVANFAMADGNLEEAEQLLKPLMNLEQLHVTEATAIFAAQAQMALKREDLESAESQLQMLEELNGPNHQTTQQIRELVKLAQMQDCLEQLKRLPRD